MPEMLLSCVPHVWRILQGVLNVVSSLRFAQSAAAAQEIAEAPPVADEARRFRGSVPIGGHEVAGNRLTRRCISFARPYRLGCCGACHTFEEFCKVSGSGAGRQTILNFDTVLPTPHLPTGRKSRSLGFLRIFGDFLCAQKVTRRRPNRPISPPVPRQNKHPRG